MRVGKNMRHCLKFLIKYPGWHDFDKRNRATREAINRLLSWELIIINSYDQIKLKGKN